MTSCEGFYRHHIDSGDHGEKRSLKLRMCHGKTSRVARGTRSVSRNGENHKFLIDEDKLLAVLLLNGQVFAHQRLSTNLQKVDKTENLQRCEDKERAVEAKKKILIQDIKSAEFGTS